MRVRTFLFIFTFSVGALGDYLDSNDLKKLSYNKLQKLRKTYIEFVKHTERDYSKKIGTNFFHYNYIIQKAYAEEGFLCFFGGWPSVYEGKYCRSPWKKSDHDLVKDFGGYTKSSSCGASDEFRCNPALFGSPLEGKTGTENIDGVQVNFSPAQNGNDPGYCVKTGGTYTELTQKCEKASAESMDGLIQSYQEDPRKLDKFTEAIRAFCEKKPSYDACDDLAKRIKDITGKDIGNFAGGAPGAAGEVSSSDDSVAIITDPGQKDNPALQVLNKCKSLLEQEGLEGSRDLLGPINSADLSCAPLEIQNLNSLADFETLTKDLQQKDLLREASKLRLESSLKALYLNTIKFNKDRVDLSALKSKENFKTHISSLYPVFSGPDYAGTLDKVYADLDQSVKSGDLIPLDKISVRDQFNSQAEEVNKACKEVHASFKGPTDVLNRNWGWYRRTFATKYEADFYSEKKKLIEGKIKALFDNSEIAHLMGTAKFKNDVMDPAEHFVEECAVNSTYKIIQTPVGQSKIDWAHKEFELKINKSLLETSSFAKAVEGPEASGSLTELTKLDPHSVLAAAQLAGTDDAAGLAGLACLEIRDIYRSDRNWKYAGGAVAGLGLSAGEAILAPLGAAAKLR